jgi:hypothetical protein
MEGNRLDIRRIRAQYLVPRDHVAPEIIKARIDDALAPRVLAQALTADLSGWFSQADERVWLIRRLDLEVLVNAAWDREHLTRAIVTQIARKLAAVLQDEPNGENILGFPNRAAYLSQFLIDLANGTAWSSWYYGSFSGLQQLPTSVALRTVICDDPEMGQEALFQRAHHELKRVLQVLSEQDARRILESLSNYREADGEFTCCQIAWAAWPALRAASFDSSDEWRRSLYLYLVAGGQPSVSAGLNLRRASIALLRLSRILATASAEQRRRILSGLTEGNLGVLHTTENAPDAEALEPLLHCPAAWVAEVAQTLIGGAKVNEEKTAPAGCRDTTFGGIFLLLPLLDELPLFEATRNWPSADEAAAITLVRSLLLVKCCGQLRAESAFYDPLLRDLMLIPPTISPDVIGDWQSKLTPEHLQSFLATLIDWQRSRASVLGKRQILASTSLRGRQVALLIDGARGHWLTAHEFSPPRPSRLTEMLNGPLKELEEHDGILICDPAFFASLWSEFPLLKIVTFEDQPPKTPDEDDRTHGILARVASLAGDLSHLALPDSFQVTSAFDLMLSVAAQQLLRSFAFRLPGFAESNLPYLFDNFLDFSSSLEDEPEHRVVRLSSPPLHLVMNLTGMSRGSYRLSWLDARPFRLTSG